MPDNEDNWIALEFEVSSLFDGAPVREEELFAGRATEVLRMLRAVMDRSKHVILFGERGVGKTSLSNVFWKRYNKTLQSFVVARVQAGPQDSFSSLWSRALDEVNAECRSKQHALSAEITVDREELHPSEIRRQLEKFTANMLPVIIIDEYDKIIDGNCRTLTANLIKELYDFSVSATVILVGVAEDIGDLIDDHKSLDRALIQVPLHRMPDNELRAIIDSRFDRTKMSIDIDATWTIIKLSRGLPYFTHALSKHAAIVAIECHSLVIKNEHVDAAMDKFIEDSTVMFRDEYRDATQSNQSNNFRQSLLACALAKTDEEGFFTATDIIEPYSSIMNAPKLISHFDKHLRRFSTSEGGDILIKRGGDRQQKFRFADPMMQPYVIIRGIKDRMVSGDVRKKLLEQEQPSLL